MSEEFSDILIQELAKRYMEEVEKFQKEHPEIDITKVDEERLTILQKVMQEMFGMQLPIYSLHEYQKKMEEKIEKEWEEEYWEEAEKELTGGILSLQDVFKLQKEEIEEELKNIKEVMSKKEKKAEERICETFTEECRAYMNKIQEFQLEKAKMINEGVKDVGWIDKLIKETEGKIKVLKELKEKSCGLKKL